MGVVGGEEGFDSPIKELTSNARRGSLLLGEEEDEGGRCGGGGGWWCGDAANPNR